MLMKQYTKFLAGVLVVAVLAVTVNFSALTANAAALTSMSDTMSNQTISQVSDHTIVFTLPTGIDFDHTTNKDIIEIDLPTTTAFSTAGTWLTSQITFNDGTARTVTEVIQTTTATVADFTATCVDAVNNVGVALDTDDLVLQIAPCGALYTASAAAATITITINSDEALTNGRLVNPSVAGSYAIALSHTDEGVADANTGSVAVPVIEDGTVDVTATVDPTITFELWTETTDCTSGRTNDTGNQSVALGSLPTSGDNISSSGTGSTAFVCLDLASNASGGAVIKVASANAQLTGDTGGAIPSASAAVTAGTANYGVCVSSTGTVTQGATAAAAAPYNGTCIETGTADSGDSTVGALSATAGNIFTISSDLTTNVIDVDEITVVVKAAASGTTPAGSYTDTLTFTATATF